ncbi:sulfurtransferase FdhD [Polaromonas eurypsychrophila]|uniref:Sulfurtransferase FdhD n=1 Tax=Polaromonas eurypsychrophila TaxID=1614635 RepID=A0A916SAU5_9BURK|nr:formate dehydrogenase accessory sulfurtransferase FdhD [Polaromonas eurypsychrophila]GGA91140.1 sulfurtransferase FdhD [Polaromonas eurypsychrophila]
MPHLTRAQAPLTCEIDAVNEYGESHKIAIPAERALTVYVDKRELVTLMTLGAHPELLVLGYLRNQRLIRQVGDIESITVDWDVGAAAVRTRHGIADIEEKTAKRVVTTGCGQGSVFGGLMDEVDQIVLPADAQITQGQLYGLVNTIRLKETTYKSAGSVHACALFAVTADEPEMLLFVEDVGRHNAIDTIAGWMWINMAPTLSMAPTFPTACDSLPLAREEGALRLRPGEASSAAPAGEEGGALAGLVFYTTGRLTSEMVIKSAQMGVPIVVSRSGITQMGHQVAQAVGLCAIGRATNKRFVCYSSAQRLHLQPELAGPKIRASAGPA